jgi:hypothetical protein
METHDNERLQNTELGRLAQASWFRRRKSGGSHPAPRAVFSRHCGRGIQGKRKRTSLRNAFPFFAAGGEILGWILVSKSLTLFVPAFASYRL